MANNIPTRVLEGGLIKASYGGRESVVKTILARGVSKDAVKTVFLTAAWRGKESILMMLLKESCFSNETLGEALVSASTEGREGAVRMLLDAGACIHFDEGGPLRWASFHGHTEIVRLLLKRGAGKNKSSLAQAIRYCQGGSLQGVECLRLILESLECPLSGMEVNREVRSGNVLAARMLLERTPDYEGDIMEDALESGNVSMIHLALEFGGRASSEHLSTSVRMGCECISRTLIESRSRASLIDEEDVLRAIRAGHCRLVQLMLEEGGDLPCQALLYALGSVPMIKTLVEGGWIDLNSGDYGWEMRVAIEEGFVEAARFLLESGVKIEKEEEEEEDEE